MVRDTPSGKYRRTQLFVLTLGHSRKSVRLHLDGCVEVEAAYYGAPPGWIDRHVQVQWDSHQVLRLDRKCSGAEMFGCDGMPNAGAFSIRRVEVGIPPGTRFPPDSCRDTPAIAVTSREA